VAPLELKYASQAVAVWQALQPGPLQPGLQAHWPVVALYTWVSEQAAGQKTQGGKRHLRSFCL
jgi:hypothetical protein